MQTGREQKAAVIERGLLGCQPGPGFVLVELGEKISFTVCPGGALRVPQRQLMGKEPQVFQPQGGEALVKTGVCTAFSPTDW